MSLAVLRRNMVITMMLIFGMMFVVVSVLAYFFDFGVLITVFLVLLFVLAQWLLSPYIIRASTRLHYLKKGENTFLESAVATLSKKAGLPIPKIAVVPDETPNAFVFGTSTSSATLAVHQGLLRNFRPEEIEGVIAHELGHIRHRDMAIMTAASAVPLVAYVLARGFFWTKGARRKDAASILAVAALSYVVYFVSELLVLYLSRSREYFADTYSAYLTKEPHNLRSALTKIAYGLSLSQKESTGLRAFYIGDPQESKDEIKNIIRRKMEYDLDRDGVLDEHELELAMQKEADRSPFGSANDLFSTHPSTFKRLLLLKKIEGELDRGQFTGDIYRFI
ncbi:MAG: M48 family metalloprotease [Theionarchaea archaeon]|nr:M48 family metalloprotease [Theionarchaea archaeon]MBU7038981.1 M48 family metalloprotease [Theionarchaea archaeon]